MPVLQPVQQPLTDQYTIMGNGWLDASHLNVNIGGYTIFVDNGSFTEVDSIGARSTLQFNADDLNGSLIFSNGEQVQIWTNGGLNMLTPNQSNAETGTTGFLNSGSSGIVLTQSTAQAWQGTHSIAAACDGTVFNQGVIVTCPVTNYIPNASYVHSIWVTGPIGVQLNVTVKRTDTFAFMASTFIMTCAGLGIWQRVSVPWITPAASGMPPAGTSFDLEVATSTPEACTFYVDGAQFEQDRDVSPWHLGGTFGGKKMFGGVLVDAQRTRVGYSSVYPIQITCVDWHYLADKRVVPSTWAYQTTGQIVRNIVDNYLAAEGVTYQRGVNMLNAQQSDVESTDMTQFVKIGTGVALSQDTSNPYHGLGDLQVTVDGTIPFQGVQIPVGINANNFPQGGTVVVSGRIRVSAGTPTVRIYAAPQAAMTGAFAGVGALKATVTVGTTVQVKPVFAGTGSLSVQPNTSTTSPITYESLTTAWQPFVAYMAIPPTLTANDIVLAVDTGAVAQSMTFFLDQMQMEIVNPTVWSPGGSGGNLLNQQQASIESSDLSSFATVGGGTTTLTHDATTSWVGNACLKVVTDGTATAQGVSTSVTNGSAAIITAGSYVMWSFYAKSTSAMTINLTADTLTTLTPFTLSAVWQRYTFLSPAGSAPPNPVVFQIETSAAEAGTFWIDGLKVEILTVPTSWELGGLTQTVYDGVTAISWVSPYDFASKDFDGLAQLSGFLWYIDPNKMLWFMLPTTFTAPWTYDGTQGVYGSQTIETSSPLYRNTQWLYNIPDVTAVQTETRHGDGTTRAFTFSYPMNQEPLSLTLNGTPQTLGIKGVDDVNHSDNFYWSVNDPVLAQDTNGTLLISTDNLVMSYIGKWTSAVYSQSAAQVSAQAALEGTSGIVEEAHNDPSITTSAQGFQLASALLARYGVQGKQITFDTKASGLAIGQMLPISFLSPGWGFPVGSLALIEQIQTVIIGQWFHYTITAIVGPFNANWVQFYQRLALIPAVGASAGTSQTVNILQSFALNWAWAVSFSTTVLTCPIIASTLKCGPTVIVC